MLDAKLKYIGLDAIGNRHTLVPYDPLDSWGTYRKEHPTISSEYFDAYYENYKKNWSDDMHQMGPIYKSMK